MNFILSQRTVATCRVWTLAQRSQGLCRHPSVEVTAFVSEEAKNPLGSLSALCRRSGYWDSNLGG
jgi:hypothetical protein